MFSPVDLAVSKISRFSDQDRQDIVDLASRRLVGADDLKTRSEAALDYYVGDKTAVRRNLSLACRDVGAQTEG